MDFVGWQDSELFRWPLASLLHRLRYWAAIQEIWLLQWEKNKAFVRCQFHRWQNLQFHATSPHEREQVGVGLQYRNHCNPGQEEGWRCIQFWKGALRCPVISNLRLLLGHLTILGVYRYPQRALCLCFVLPIGGSSCTWSKSVIKWLRVVQNALTCAASARVINLQAVDLSKLRLLNIFLSGKTWNNMP